MGFGLGLKLHGSATVGGGAPAAITYVGGATMLKQGNTTSTIPLTSGLTGGTGATAEIGDFVLAIHSNGSNADRTLPITDGAVDYTLIGSELFANDTRDINLRSAYKFMDGSVDASTTFGASAGADNSCCAVLVFRGVDAATPLDVAVVQGTSINGGQPNPGSITPTTSGAFIVIIGAGSCDAASPPAIFATSGLTDFRSVIRTAISSFGCLLGVGHLEWPGGAYDHAAFTDGSTAVEDSAAMTAIALRPG